MALASRRSSVALFGPPRSWAGAPWVPEIFPLSAFAFRRDRADGVGRDVPPASQPPATFATCRSPRRFDPLASARDDAKAGLAAPTRRPPLGVLTHLVRRGRGIGVNPPRGTERAG